MRLILLALPILAASSSDQAVSIKHTPKQGETEKYQATIIFDLGGNDVVYKSTLTEKVLAIDKDGSYSVQSDQTGISAMNADREMGVDPKAPPLTTIYNRLGQVLQLKGNETSDALKISYMGQFCYPEKPVVPGDTWTVKIPQNLDRNTSDMLATYTFVGAQKLNNADALLVSEEFKENVISNPVSASMRFWLDPATGVILKMDGDWRNAPLMGTQSLVNAHVSYVRIG